MPHLDLTQWLLVAIFLTVSTGTASIANELAKLRAQLSKTDAAWTWRYEKDCLDKRGDSYLGAIHSSLEQVAEASSASSANAAYEAA